RWHRDHSRRRSDQSPGGLPQSGSRRREQSEGYRRRRRRHRRVDCGVIGLIVNGRAGRDMNRIFATLLLLAGLSLLAWAQARSQKVTPGRQAAPPRSGATSSKDEPYWETLKIGFDDEFQKIAFPARMVGYVAGKKGVYKTGDGGRTWNHLLEA